MLVMQASWEQLEFKLTRPFEATALHGLESGFVGLGSATQYLKKTLPINISINIWVLTFQNTY